MKRAGNLWGELISFANLLRAALKARRGMPGLSPDRADIIVAGLAVIDRLMLRFNVNALQIHSRGVRDGLLLTMIDQSLGKPSEDPRDREAAARLHRGQQKFLGAPRQPKPGV